MDFGEILAAAWWQTWRQRWLWLLGLLLALPTITAVALRLWLLDGVVQRLLAGAWQTVDPVAVLAAVNERLLPWGIAAFALLLLLWVLGTIAEAGVIVGVSADGGQRPFPATTALRHGARWLGRFIAIDTVLFLPWFVLALAVLVVVFSSLAGSALLAANDAAWQTLLGTLGTGLACLLPLLCLLPPLSIVTFVLRRLALRAAVQQQAGVGAAIRLAWQQLRARWLDVAILAALLWGFGYFLGMVLQGVELGVVATDVATSVPFPPLAQLFIRLLGLLLLALPLALSRAWTAVAWTLAWQELTE